MHARSARLCVAILGFLALCLPNRAGPALSATSSPCAGRHDVTFSAAADSVAQTVIAGLACATARTRGLTAHTPVVVRLLDAAALRAQVLQISQQDTTSQPITGLAVALQLLGALTPHDDLATIRRAQYNLGTAAEYDYHSRILFVRADAAHFNPLDQAIVAHEYTRALQDQYFHLAALLSVGGAEERNLDALLAREAVVEGDAITTMAAVASATFSRQELLWLNQQLQRPANTVSDFANDLFSFPASQGTSFVKTIVQAAAKGKRGDAAQAAAAAINGVLANPPSATAQIIYPPLYFQHVSLGDVAPALPALDLGVGWTEVGSDVLGAYGVSDLFGDRAQQAVAQAGAQWQSDRWSVFQRGGDSIMLWRLHFTGATGAQAFVRTLAAYTAGRFHAGLSPQPSMDWHTGGYALSVRQQGVAVSVAMGSSQGLAVLCSRAADQLGAS